MKRLLWILLIIPSNYIINSESQRLLNSPTSSTGSVDTILYGSSANAQHGKAVIRDPLKDNNTPCSSKCSSDDDLDHDQESSHSSDTAPYVPDGVTFALPMRPYCPEDDERSNHSIDRNPPQNNMKRNICVLSSFLVGSFGLGSLIEYLSR